MLASFFLTDKTPLRGQIGVESPQMARRKGEEKGFKLARSCRILWDGEKEI